MVMFPKRNLTLDHIVPKAIGRNGPLGESVAALWGLQLIEGQEVTGGIPEGSGEAKGADSVAPVTSS